MFSRSVTEKDKKRVQLLDKSGKPHGMIEVYDIGNRKALKVTKNIDGSYTWQFGKFVPREYINEGA